jgi:2,3-bisphosphoglycerate-dependent phosphoglycerate mutase
VAFTSLQTRAIRTLHLALEAAGRLWIPETKDWRLNERHYGGLTGPRQGRDGGQARRRAGQDLAAQLRYSAADLLEDGSRIRSAADPRYAGIAIPRPKASRTRSPASCPITKAIVPHLKAGETVLISAHGNSLRALVKHLSGISDDEITGLEIPTGQPIVYELELDDSLAALERYYLAER